MTAFTTQPRHAHLTAPWAGAAIALSTMLASPARADETTPATPGAFPAEVATVAQWLQGAFDSSKQAATDPDYFNVVLQSCPVSVLDDNSNELRDAAYLYVEQAIAGREQAPYRQRLYRIADAGKGTQGTQIVRSEILLLSEPQSYIGTCSGAAGKRVIARSAVEDRGCSVFLQTTTDERGQTRFEGRTPEGGCPSTFNGATTVTSYVSLGSDSLIAWDIGRDANGNQVWGPEKGPYIFLRRPQQ